MPRFTSAASATSRIVRPEQPRVGKSSRPAARSARSRFLEGRGMAVTIRTYNYVVKRLELDMSSDARERLEEAGRRHGAGDLAGAIAALREAIALDPGLGAAHKNLAVLLSQSGRLAEARDALAAAVAALPAEPSLWARLAHAELDAGNPSGAFAAARRAEAEEPRDAVSWTIIGGLHSEFGRYADAERALSRASALDPGAPEIELRLAHAL